MRFWRWTSSKLAEGLTRPESWHSTRVIHSRSVVLAAPSYHRCCYADSDLRVCGGKYHCQCPVKSSAVVSRLRSEPLLLFIQIIEQHYRLRIDCKLISIDSKFCTGVRAAPLPIRLREVRTIYQRSFEYILKGSHYCRPTCTSMS